MKIYKAGLWVCAFVVFFFYGSTFASIPQTAGLLQEEKRTPEPSAIWSLSHERLLPQRGDLLDRHGRVLNTGSRKRLYPHGPFFATHLLGYLGYATQSQLEANKSLQPGDLMGKLGLEVYYDRHLRGRPGLVVREVDLVGREGDILRHEPATPGLNAHLSLDLDWQLKAEEFLAGKVGAVILLESETGWARVLASAPRFPVGSFAPVIPYNEWRKWVHDERLILLNRPTQAVYPLGGLSELLTMLVMTAVDNHASAGPDDEAVARQLGLDELTGIDLGSEEIGEVPKDGVLLGKTANMNELMLTPLQVANLTAIIANAGYVYRPRLLVEMRNRDGKTVKSVEPQRFRTLHGVEPGRWEWLRGNLTRRVLSTAGPDPELVIHGMEAVIPVDQQLQGAAGSPDRATDSGHRLAWFTGYARPVSETTESAAESAGPMVVTVLLENPEDPTSARTIAEKMLMVPWMP